MSTELLISILGAITAVVVSLVGAFMANRNSLILQIRKLKENHYSSYMDSLHFYAADNNDENLAKLVLHRDKMLLIASESVVKKMHEFEEKGVGKSQEMHDKHLTELVKEIRKDLKLKDKNFPLISFKKATLK